MCVLLVTEHWNDPGFQSWGDSHTAFSYNLCRHMLSMEKAKEDDSPLHLQQGQGQSLIHSLFRGNTCIQIHRCSNEMNGEY